MSLFDLQDVCIAIGSLTTLDLPMVVDLIGIYGLKGPYCTLTTTNWFLQALSVIPSGSWGDVARRFTMIRWATLQTAAPSSPSYRRRRPPPSSSPPPLSGICSGQLFEEFPSVLISSGLLVQADEGTLLPVVDLIRRNLPPPTVKSQSPCDSGWSHAPVASKNRPGGGSASRGGSFGGSSRRDDRKGSSTKRRSSSGGGGGSGTAGGPYKKNAEWWLYGKNQF
ncbi:acyl-CoA dehydrogenase-related protein [Dorcoceras hygrometricum]|uniref:Acyl-CoA dehydrogenase-related protein n=1 Tax=Dorcoceras hygrometricum TaxID=472368 RepID=A0A2Z7CGK1_9LAMI|nr:acyl-CoA dehydrogenase-related protein [Dorcoceras hygrometricum]